MSIELIEFLAIGYQLRRRAWQPAPQKTTVRLLAA
jgi:hypothetical protein